jgi:hypothetical protein
MAYTMTFDASHKVSRGGHAKKFFRHIARDVDQAAGFSFPQTNPNIVPERTPLNVTVVNDGSGGFRRPRSVAGRPPSDELDDYLGQRLSTVERALRKDAILMRGVILQLDPRWFEKHNADWRHAGLSDDAIAYTSAALDWACKEFGQINIVGWSLHLDEYNPQLQTLITPVTADRRLSQKDFFKGPSDLKRQHQEVRAAVAAAGYNVEFRVTERSREHLSSSEYQSKANWLKAAARQAASDHAINERIKTKLATRSIDLDAREMQIIRRERDAAAARADAEAANRRAQEVERHAARAHAAALRAREEAEAEKERLRNLRDRLEVVPADIDRWLDQRSTRAGVPMREVFEADMAKTRSSRRRVLNAIESSSAVHEPEKYAPEL